MILEPIHVEVDLKKELGREHYDIFYYYFLQIFLSEFLIKIFTARRCFVMANLFLDEMVRKGVFALEKAAEIRKTMYTDCAFQIVAEKLKKKYENQEHFKKDDMLLICDDILIHGRALNKMLHEYETRFSEKNDAAFEDTHSCLDNIKLKIAVRNSRLLFLEDVYFQRLVKAETFSTVQSFNNWVQSKTFDSEKPFLLSLEPTEWRDISNRISKTILASTMPNASFILSSSLSVTQIDGLKILFDEEREASELPDGFIAVENEYQKRKLYTFVKKITAKGDSDIYFTIRFTPYHYQSEVESAAGYIIPFVFLPRMKTEIFDVFARYILKKLEELHIADLRDGELLELYRSWENLPRAQIEFISMILSQFLLRCFLKQLNRSLQEKIVLNHSYNIEQIMSNYAHDNRVEKIMRALTDAASDEVYEMDMLIDMLRLVEGDRIDSENSSLEFNLKSLDMKSSKVEQMEDFIYRDGLQTEKRAYHVLTHLNAITNVRRESCYISMHAVDEVIQPFVQDDEPKKSAETIALILQFMDFGVLALTAERLNDTYTQCVRAGEQSLALLPKKMYRYTGFLASIERTCQYRELWTEEEFKNQLEYFINQFPYEKDRLSEKQYSFCEEILEEKDVLLSFVHDLYSSGQTCKEWSFDIIEDIDENNDKQALRDVYYAVVQ